MYDGMQYDQIQG